MDKSKYLLEAAKIYHNDCVRWQVQNEKGLITRPTGPFKGWEDLTQEQKEARLFMMGLFMKKIAELSQQVVIDLQDRPPEYLMGSVDHVGQCLVCQRETKAVIIRNIDKKLFFYCTDHIQGAMKKIIGQRENNGNDN